MTITKSVPAKINLWLEVIGKRSDGYHELSSLMLPIGIYDHLHLELRPGNEISLQCNRSGVPLDAQNLAWRAAESFFEAAEIKHELLIRLTKDIPVGAGLGGGSADAAAVLLALNQVLETRFSTTKMEEIARKLGADVPFFLYQQPALATGIGEKLDRVQGLPAYPLVLIKPPVSVSTRWVYQSLKLTRGGSAITLARILTDPWRLQDMIENDLESVTLVEYPLLAKVKEWLLQQGAAGALMSGSGPTVFGVFRDDERAEAVESQARQEWKQCWVAKTNVLAVSAPR